MIDSPVFHYSYNQINNFNMQALIIASRSINQDQFFQKQAEEKYKKHLKYIKFINNDTNIPIHEWQNQVETMTTTLRKSKSAAKTFKTNQEKLQLKNQNMHLLKKIWNLEPTIKTFNQDPFQHISGSNRNIQKKKLSEIKKENKRNYEKLQLQKHLEKTEFKKKLKSEIKDYIELRDGIRKFKISDSKLKRSCSQRKMSVGLKLKKVESAQNMEQQGIKQVGVQKKAPQLQQSIQVKLI